MFSLRPFNTVWAPTLCQAYTPFSSRSTHQSQPFLKEPFHCLPRTLLVHYCFFHLHCQPVSPSPLASFLLLVTVSKNFQLGKLTGQLWLRSLDSDLMSWHRVSLEWHPLLMSPRWAQLQDLPHMGTCQVLCTLQLGAQEASPTCSDGHQKSEVHNCRNYQKQEREGRVRGDTKRCQDHYWYWELNSRTFGKVKKMINLALNKLSLKLIELGSNQGKMNRLFMIQKQWSIMGKILELIYTRFIFWLYQLLTEWPSAS